MDKDLDIMKQAHGQKEATIERPINIDRKHCARDLLSQFTYVKRRISKNPWVPDLKVIRYKMYIIFKKIDFYFLTLLPCISKTEQFRLTKVSCFKSAYFDVRNSSYGFVQTF